MSTPTSTDNTVEIPAQVPGPLSPEQAAEQAAQQPAEGQENHQPQQQPQQPTPAEALPADAQSLAEQRGEVAKVLESGGLNLDNLEDEYAANGGLTDSSYEALAKMGFSKKVVDTWIAGVEAANTKAVILQEQEVQSIKGMVGGDEAYASLTAWAKDNLTPEEIAGFNAITATNDVQAIRQAVKGLAAQYHMSAGKDPNYVSGQAPGHTPQDVFMSWAEVTKAMSDARYQNDPAYVAQVQGKLARSSL